MARKSASSRKGGSGVQRALADLETPVRTTYGQLDDALAATVREAQEKQACDGQIFSAQETLARNIFLPLPALAPRFLLHNEGWPLSRFSLLSGLEESCKSAFSYEIGRWHRNLGGHLICIETEQKDAAGLRNSFFNYDPKAWYYSRAFSQDQWNKLFFWWTENLHRLMDGGEAMVEQPDGSKKKIKTKGIGRVGPSCIVVDSISAVTIEKFVEQMEESGHPSMNHPMHAKMLSDFFKVGPKHLVDYPISLVAISHLKMSNDPRAPHIQVRNVSGGAAPKFQMTTHIEMRRKAGQSTRVHKKYGEMTAIDLTMQVRKNSLGDHENIRVEMCWYFDPEDIDPLTGRKRQKTFFDWHSATIELLELCMRTGDEGKGFKSPRAKALRDMIDLDLNQDRRLASSRALGVSPEDKLTYQELGEVLEYRISSDESFRKELYDIMGIREQFMFRNGVDLRQQFAENATRLAELEKKRSLTSSADIPLPTAVEPVAAPQMTDDPLDVPLENNPLGE